MVEQETTLANINKSLGETLRTVKEINRNPVRPGDTKISGNLDEELKRRKLTTNEPT
jgi:hypothetical protein